MSFFFRMRICVVLLCLLPVLASAQEVSVPFSKGFVGAVGQNTSKADDILTFETPSVSKVRFSQTSETGVFGGTQGNDLSGTLHLLLTDGSEIQVAGAMNWRITTNGLLDFFGFIPDPGGQPQTITYPGGSYVLDATRNYGLLKIGRLYSFADGDNISGNAAKSGLVADLNLYLAEIMGSTPLITGLSGVLGAESESIRLLSGTALAGVFSANVGVTWSISGGDDRSLFMIDPASGELSFSSPPDAAAPADANGDNIYLVQIEATDSIGFFSHILVQIEVYAEPDISVLKEVRLVSDPSGSFDCAAGRADPEASFFGPGACVEYRIVVASAANGSAPVGDFVLSDALPAQIEFVAVLDSTGFDAVDVAGQQISGQCQNLGPGAFAELVFRAVIR